MKSIKEKINENTVMLTETEKEQFMRVAVCTWQGLWYINNDCVGMNKLHKTYIEGIDCEFIKTFISKSTYNEVFGK
jgi:hypothetical protein